MADIQYLNYGDQQIEQQALLNNLANQVQGYVQSQPWSNKRKEKFMSAYSDLMNRGILGASNNTGQWMIDVNGDPLPEMSRKDKEMYQEAAYFIQQQMAALPTKTAEEEKKVEDLPVFDFNKDFITYVNNSINGGQPLNIGYGDSDQWNYLDERDSNGIRGRKNRAKKLAELLESYKTKLGDGSKYKFEGSPYSDINDFNTKIDRAIAALKTDSIDDDREALQAIGLNQATWFNNGSGDPSGKVDANGNPLTYGQLSEQQEQKVLEEQGQQEKLNQQNKIKNSGVLTISANNNPLDAIYNAQKYQEHLGTTYGVGQTGFNSINDKVQELLERSYNGGKGNGLNSAERKQLGNLIHYIRTNNPNYQNYNLSKQDEAELSKHESLKGKRLQDFVRLPWQTSDGRYTYADKSGNIYFLKPQNQAKLAAPTFQRSAAYNNYRNNFLKSENNKALNITIGSNNGLTDDMKADLAAMGLDLVSAGSAFAPGYGTLASAVTGIGATLTGAAADRMRGESWGSTLGTAGFGLSMDILGLIPGVGVGAKAAKIAKVVSKGAKWIGPALGGLAAMSYGPGAISAYNKFTSGKKDDITAEELRDFTYAIRAIAAGGIRKAGATYQGNRTLAKAKVKGNVVETAGKQSASITTKNGQKINLTDDEFKTLKSNANRETKAKIITQAAQREKINMEGDEIEWKGINPVKGRFKTSSKSSKLSGLQEGIESSQLKWNTTSADYKGIRRFSNENLLRGFTTMSTPSSGIWRSLRDRWNGNDILNSNPVSASQKEAIKQELKALPRKPYNKPTTSNQEVIPESRRLPQPGGEHKGTRIDVQRTGTSSTKNISTGEAVKEFTDFDRMYIASTRKNSKVPSKAFGNGYGTSKEPESGSLDFNGITATITKLDGDRGFTLAFGKTGDTVRSISYKNIQELRSNLAQQLNKVIKKQNNVKETAALLRQFKAKGWLKQGGTIDKQRIQLYKEFIKK